jgi:cytoskeletal protein RodZ
MRSFLSLSIAALLMMTTLVNGAAAQQAKSSTKARKAKSAKVQTPSAPPAPAKPTTPPPQTAQAKKATPPVLSTPTPDDGAQRITVAELRVALASGTAILVDVRSDDAYKAEHIKGAILIPVYEIAARYKELPKDKLIATYCS